MPNLVFQLVSNAPEEQVALPLLSCTSKKHGADF